MIYLRTLTERSQLKFGKHYDLTVHELLILQKHRYLRWIYFNCSMITFMPNILELIRIDEEFIIDKPGKAPELYDDQQDRILSRCSSFQQMKIASHLEKNRKIIGLKANHGRRNILSKSIMQARNHGHNTR